MRKLFSAICLLFLLSCLSVVSAQSTSSYPIRETEQFRFYSNFWVNMHHMWFQKATQAKDTTWQAVFDESFIDQLNNKEKESLGIAMDFYKEHAVGNSLVFNGGLFRLKRTLINFEQDELISGKELPHEIFDILNDTKSIYKRYFWDKHHQKNLAILSENIEWILMFENPAFERISDLAQKDWPEGTVRVDISYYSNWAGAYTSTSPETHVVITSQDEDTESNWLELLFHESSHAVISNDEYSVAEAIQKASEELGMDPPRSLWHSLLFYFSGITVQDLLAKEGIDYELYMIRNDVFSRYHEVILEYMPAYVNGNESLEVSLGKLIKAYNQ